jgi:hypothetical protein
MAAGSPTSRSNPSATPWELTWLQSAALDTRQSSSLACVGGGGSCRTFGIAFGLAGLGEAWHAAGPVLGIPRAVPDAIYILAAGAWLALVAAYARQGPGTVLADLRDPVLAPFVSVAAITPITPPAVTRQSRTEELS